MPISELMVLRLQDKAVPCQEALELIVSPEADYRGTYSIAELKDVLMSEPFTVPTEKDAIKLARYIIEDEQTERLVFDERVTNEVKVVYSIMKNLLGSYMLLSAEETLQIQKDLIRVGSFQLESTTKEGRYHALLQDQSRTKN